MSVGTIMVGVHAIEFDPVPLVHVSVAAVRAEGVRIRAGWFSLQPGEGVQLVEDVPQAVLLLSHIVPGVHSYAQFLLFESMKAKPQDHFMRPGDTAEIELV